MQFLEIGENRLEYVWHGPAPSEAATLVFLHEGLGCVALWRDFPERLVAATGCGALVYSRSGYGNSSPIATSRDVRFMHEEALVTLPRIIDVLGIEKAIPVGHSDGGSIALIYAGGVADERVQGMILEAPHVFVEEVGLDSIRSIADEYREGDLKSRLEKYHGKNVDQAFWGWNDVWLAPEFASWNIEAYLGNIQVPVLVLQGSDDQYGTWAQVEAIKQGCKGLVQTVCLQECGHAPHLDQPDRTLEAMTNFIKTSGVLAVVKSGNSRRFKPR
jgi:pimeloyl-ACP methyl ester carboxylesterase